MRKNYIGNSQIGLRVWGGEPFSNISIDDTLDHLYDNLPLKDWILTGGLAVDVACGRQIRPRYDVDICVPFESLQKTVAKMQREPSEYLFELGITRLPRPIARDIVTFPKEITPEKLLNKHFKFVSRSYLASKTQRIEDVVDVFTSVEDIDLTKGVCLREIKNDVFFYTTKRGNKISVYGPKYQVYLKEIWQRKKDKTDVHALKVYNLL